MQLAQIVRGRNGAFNRRMSAEILEGRVLLSAAVTTTLGTMMGPVHEVTPPADYSFSKLTSILHDGYSDFELTLGREGTPAAKTWQPNDHVLRVSDGEVSIEAFPNPGTSAQTLANEIAALGGTRTQAIEDSVAAAVPVGMLPELSAIADMHMAREVAAVTAAGSVDSQGNTAMNVSSARTTFGVDGTGVKVGVISDSYNNLGGAAADVTSGDLPAGVQVIQDEPSGGSDEGRAMMQIVHDLAPGSPLAFATAFVSETGFASNITALKNAGAKVIVDDVSYLDEPMFQDGVVAQAAEAAATGGSSYFSAAANESNAGYESPWRSDNLNLASGLYGASFLGGKAFDFDPGSGVDTMQQFTIPGNHYMLLAFQWDSPYFSVSGGAGSTNDCDIYALNSAGTSVVASSTDNNTGADADEIMEVDNFSASTTTYNLMLVNRSGTTPGYLKYVNFGAGTFTQFAGGAGTIFGHSNIQDGAAVAAAYYGNTPAYGVSPPVVESFSSQGTTPKFFANNGTRLSTPVILSKPDFTAVDGVNTTLSGSSGLNPFYGTSAAAPHAAAVAALMYQLTPGASNAGILSAIRNGAIDMDDPNTTGFDTGFDIRTGWGLLQADGALAAIGAGTADNWTGLGDGVNWTDPNNWSTHAVPTWRSDVTLNVAANPTIVVSGTQWAHTINDSESLNVTGTLNVASTGTLNAGITSTITGALGGAANLSIMGTVNWNNGSILGSGTLTVNASGILNVGGSGARVMTRSLVVNGTVLLGAGGNKTLVIPGYTRNGSGQLDLNDDDMIVNYSGYTPRTAMETDVVNARSTGSWTGNGLNSTAAKNKTPKITTLGIMEATEYKSIYGSSATFNTLNIDNTAVLVKYTYFGDVDFSGKVDGGDYARLDITFAREATAGIISGWVNGDTNYDGRVNGSDYGLADLAFGGQTGIL